MLTDATKGRARVLAPIVRRVNPVVLAVGLLISVVQAAGPSSDRLVTVGGAPPPRTQAPDAAIPLSEVVARPTTTIPRAVLDTTTSTTAVPDAIGAGPPDDTVRRPGGDDLGAVPGGPTSDPGDGGAGGGGVLGDGGAGSGPGPGDPDGVPPTPQGPEVPEPPAPPTEPHPRRDLQFGVSAHPSSTGGSPTFTAAQSARAVVDMAPGSIVRITVPWQQVQPGRNVLGGGACPVLQAPSLCVDTGEMSWQFLDRELPDLRAAGLRVLLVPTSAPPWARSHWEVVYANSGGAVMAPPADEPGALGAWQGFVAEMVAYVQRNYPGMLAGVEVWNEPNGNEFWTTSQPPDPARYVNLLCAAHRGVKAVDPSVPVLFGGTNPQPPFVVKLSVPDFVGAAYGAGAAACMDQLAIHAYPHVSHAGERSQLVAEQLDAFDGTMTMLREVAASHGDGGRPLAITEVNIGRHDATEEDMATFLAGAYRAAADMPDVSMFLVYTLFDRESLGGFDAIAGVCNGPGSPDAAATALKQAVTGSTDPATC